MQTVNLEIPTIIICTFRDIRPINTVKAGIEEGHLTGIYPFITDRTAPLQAVSGKKDLHLVCFARETEADEYAELLQDLEMRPCRNGPNYLLGFMARVPEVDMPVELRGKNFLAAEPRNSFSVFYSKNGFRCFLCVNRRSACRELSFAHVDGKWGGFWAFLAEDIPPEDATV